MPRQAAPGIDPNDGGVSDAMLVAAVANVVRCPRVDNADSFVLHAPLELAARSALLPMVRPDRRADARSRIAAIADRFDAFGDGAAPPRRVEFESAAAGAVALGDAITAGDLEAVDERAASLGRTATATALRSLLTAAVLPRLSAAAHAPIFLYQLPRVAPRGEITPELLRPLARELARFPDWKLGWVDDEVTASSEAAPAEALFDAIADTPRLGVPGSSFIYPLMHLVDETGVAAELLGGPVRAVDVGAGSRTLLAAAALSMLTEPSDHAPYGWTHCLTMPQAVLGSAMRPATRVGRSRWRPPTLLGSAPRFRRGRCLVPTPPTIPGLGSSTHSSPARMSPPRQPGTRTPKGWARSRRNWPPGRRSMRTPIS